MPQPHPLISCIRNRCGSYILFPRSSRESEDRCSRVHSNRESEGHSNRGRNIRGSDVDSAGIRHGGHNTTTASNNCIHNNRCHIPAQHSSRQTGNTDHKHHGEQQEQSHIPPIKPIQVRSLLLSSETSLTHVGVPTSFLPQRSFQPGPAQSHIP